MSIELNGRELTFDLLVKPMLKHVCMMWHLIEEEGLSLLYSMCAMVF